MPLSRYFFVATVMFIAQSAVRAQSTVRVFQPTEAIIAAAEAAEKQRGVFGNFEMQVRASGRQNGLLYLNSELDYRDQRSLTVEITPIAEQELRSRFGADLETALKGKRIQVTGAAQRVTIWFSCNGQRTDKYYFQTHVGVSAARQLKIVDSVAALTKDPQATR